MKAVLLLNQNEQQNTENTIKSLANEGIGEFIIFSHQYKKSQQFIDELTKNGINATFIDLNRRISTFDALDLIKGSLNDTFLLVYSDEVSNFDINDAHYYHKSNEKLATLLSSDKLTAGIFLENDDFDYMIEPNHFEKVIIKRLFEDDEALVYSALTYELY